MTLDESAAGLLNIPDACCKQLLQIEHVANYIQQFRREIRSGNTEIDWQLAMENMSSRHDSQRLVLRKKYATEAAELNTLSGRLSTESIVNESVDDGGSSSGSFSLANDSVASVEILPSTSSAPEAVHLVVRKRHADQLESQPNPKRTSACETENLTSSSSISVNITFEQNGNREERKFKLAAELRGAKITIEFPKEM